MCEIFPDVEKCCLVINLRVGMLIISVLCIMSGVTLLCIVEQRTNASFDNLSNITNIKNPQKAMAQSRQLIVTGLAGMSVVFMLTGLILFFATLTDQEGFVQVFVWATFLSVLVGFLLTILVGVDCLMHPVCLLSDMDWLSASALLVLVIGYLFLWIYFITVANSYVLNSYS